MIAFTLPSFVARVLWKTILDTFDDRRVGEICDGAVSYALAPHSLALFVMHPRMGPNG